MQSLLSTIRDFLSLRFQEVNLGCRRCSFLTDAELGGLLNQESTSPQTPQIVLHRQIEENLFVKFNLAEMGNEGSKDRTEPSTEVDTISVALCRSFKRVGQG